MAEALAARSLVACTSSSDLVEKGSHLARMRTRAQWRLFRSIGYIVKRGEVTSIGSRIVNRELHEPLLVQGPILWHGTAPALDQSKERHTLQSHGGTRARVLRSLIRNPYTQ